MSVKLWKWATTDEAVTHYGVSLRTLQRWALDEKIAYKREGGRSYYGIEDILSPIIITEDSEETADNDEIDAAGSIDNWLDLVKTCKDKAVLFEPISVEKNKATKILVLSDLHFPFQNEVAIDEALAAHKDADILVLNGDILDVYGASSFAKDKTRTIMEEYKLAMDFLIRVSKMFKHVYLLEGNHERRIDTFFSKKIDPHMYALVDHDLLDKLAKGHILDRDGNRVGTYKFSNVYYNDKAKGYFDPWQLIIGKTVFIHPNGYSSQEMRTIVTAQEHADNFYGHDAYDSIVMGHTHDCGKMIRRGKLLIEQGCLSQVMDYNKKGKMSKRPNSVGYAVIYQDKDGNTDFNKSDYVYLGTLNYAGTRNK